MPSTFYQASIPVFIRTLNNLSAFFEKGLAHAESAKFDVDVLLNARLYPDMHPFSRQIKIATDTASGVAARLAGLEPPVLGHEDVTVAALKARLADAVAFLETINADQLAGGEERSIEVTRRDNTATWLGRDYLFNYGLPNFYFHVTTAYAILRHNGVPIGKRDFLGS
ncbi:DUF1993 domain-containing protein [Candidatus Methylospira mobilis]|uniref:DUF1993 domain-containing protein n=1 Tax=Candidatus Methylospira mobilis TaxID=1808979 RepID=A0A5Q0BHZ6_9GAMM|nr:DUF1993 domain-containing protein [Candidatus Methylospira mobilis]QFY42742.1 DUF1993 domain-containing protein [Candidatus Methylospira mobilis]WNV04133.1 DUF1993 domain-containing protein [Candidatus Methylospira mobilis]